jgi:hypothetical protein
MLIQGIQGALSNQRFQMNPNNREPVAVLHARQLPEQNWLANSAQRTLQQTMD